ncbi:MAG: hypothetical protein M3362_00575 [Acidobacteriota bacterium]|nr:hypothetical protein [Acidobacteriota bacterium]
MPEPITNELAEIVGAVHESITALSLVSTCQHLAHLFRHSRDEAGADEGTAASFESERQQSEEELERANAKLRGSLRKLEAIKLRLEGQTPGEIRATFAARDSAVAAFAETIGARHESSPPIAAEC